MQYFAILCSIFAVTEVETIFADYTILNIHIPYATSNLSFFNLDQPLAQWIFNHKGHS